jgi:hypothetical protein
MTDEEANTILKSVTGRDFAKETSACAPEPTDGPLELHSKIARLRWIMGDLMLASVARLIR